MSGMTIVSEVIGEYRAPVGSRTFNGQYHIYIDTDGHLVMLNSKTLEPVCLIDDCFIQVRRLKNKTSGTILVETHDKQELMIDLPCILYWWQE